MLIKHFYTKSLIKCPQVWHTLCIQLDTAQYAASQHSKHRLIKASWNVMAHAQKPDFVFWRNGRFHLNRRVIQFSQLAAEVNASAVVMLDRPCSEVVWRVLATHPILQFPLHFPPSPLLHRVPSHFNCSLPRFIYVILGVEEENSIFLNCDMYTTLVW